MGKLVLTRGIPASGKTTWAKAWVSEDPERRVRVNRDDLRRMMFGGDVLKLDWERESQVTYAEQTIAVSALVRGMDVVVDATNLRWGFARQWFEFGYEVVVRDFPVSLDVALARNAARGRPVPDSVVARFHRDVSDGLWEVPAGSVRVTSG